MNVRLTEDQKIKILNSEDIYGIMQRILLRENKIGRNKEHFWIVGLASNNRILFIELISLGTINRTLVEPVEVFSFALQKRAVSLILAHNHPSGELGPSEDDKDITDHLIQVGKFVSIPIIDHLIITEKAYYSFSDSGLLAKLSLSKRYALRYKEEERIKEESKRDMAKQMKKNGEPIQKITIYTGLPKKEVEKL